MSLDINIFTPARLEICPSLLPTGGVSPSATVTVTVEETGETPYDVQAQIVKLVPGSAGNLTWKGVLKPHSEQGGNVTVTARCTGCMGNNTVAVITNVTFGDVWFCAGRVRV